MFFVVAGLIGFAYGGALFPALLWIVVITISVLVHELGHALTALAFGQTASIQLVAMGGLTERRGHKLPLWQEFLVVADGPAFGFLLYLTSVLLLTNVPNMPSVLGALLLMSAFINLSWSLLNLLPIGPLDGAKLLSILLEGALGARGLRLSFLISAICGLLLSMLAFAFQQPILGAILFLLTFESIRSYQAHRSMTEEDRDGDLQQVYREGQLALEEGHKRLAEEKFVFVCGNTRNGLMHQAASEQLAHLLSERGEFEEAYQLLVPMADEVHPQAVQLLHRLAHRMEDTKMVCRVGDRCFDIDGSPDTAYLNGLAHASLGHVEPSIGWLQRAKEEGFEDLASAIARPQFDTIRNEPLFRELADSL